MGYSVRSMIDMSFACLMFVTAVTIGLLLFQSGAASLDVAYGANQLADRSVHSTLSPLAGDGNVTGAEVLQSIAHIEEIGVEIVVDGIVLTPQLEREEVIVSGIRTNGMYRPVYERGPQGELQRIRFNSL